MNGITEAAYKWQLPKFISKKCGIRIPRSGKAGEKVNCFVVFLTKNSEPFFLLNNIDSKRLVGFIWDQGSFSKETNLSISSIREYGVLITHFYGFDTIEYTGIYDYLINRITMWPYIKIHISRLFNRADQYVFNKKELVTKERIDLLKFMVDDHAERTEDGISLLGLMQKLYTFKWIYHPDRKSQERKLKLYLSSMVDNGDLLEKNNQYIVTGKAIDSIEKYEHQERRHRENVKMQKRAFWLTIIIVLLTLVQAGVIKFPVLLDFTK